MKTFKSPSQLVKVLASAHCADRLEQLGYFHDFPGCGLAWLLPVLPAGEVTGPCSQCAAFC